MNQFLHQIQLFRLRNCRALTTFSKMQLCLSLILLSCSKFIVDAQSIGPGPDSLWPNGLVPYDINPNYSAEDRQNLQRAIEDYQSKTCIRWVPRSGEAAYVHFQRVNDGCAYADNCYDRGRRVASFGSCRNWDTMVHEMGHTLCYGHEQDRNDKDNYIERRCAGNGLYDHLNFGHLYDYRSIMHYGGMGGSCAKLPGVTDTGSPTGLSVLDAEKLNDAYNCRGCMSYRFRFPNQINGNSNPVVGGADGGQTVYVCRAYVNGDIVPGKAVLGSEPACWLPYDGREVKLDTGFEILTNPERANLRWVRNSGQPSNAIAGGRAVNAESLYVARCYLPINGETLVTPGKMHGNDVYAPYGGREIKCSDYEVLVC